MQGLWKNKVEGWNHKDSRRKKQKRKHFIKDKYNFISRGKHEQILEDKGVLTFDKKFIEITEYDIPEYTFEETFIIRCWYNRYWCPTSVHRVKRGKGYYNEGFWVDVKDNSRVARLDLSKNSSYRWGRYDDVTEVEFIRNDEPLVTKNSNAGWYCTWDDNPYFGGDKKEFYYGKELGYQGKWWKRGNPHKPYAKKLANRTTRAKSKNWLNKKDWEQETEIKNHALEKSIAWELY